MTDQTGGAAAASEPAPLQPPAPTATLTLTPPEPVQVVAATQAPRMAPPVDAAALPGLDAKVDGYLDALLKADAKSPQFATQANDVRTMGDEDIRRAAETSNRPLEARAKRSRRGDVGPPPPGAGQGAQRGRPVAGLEGRRHARRAAPHGRGARPQGRHRTPQDPRGHPSRRP